MKALEIENLSKSFGKNIVLDKISFSVSQGEIVGLLGKNGSGKSTMMKCISGLMSFDSGSVKIYSHDIDKDRIRALENIGVTIESPALYPNMSGLDHLRQMAAWRGLGQDRIKEMIEYSGINLAYMKKRISTYSMGMKMRLILAMVMIHQPKVLILDEPMNGLDPDGVMDLRKKLLDLKSQKTSILISSHQLAEMEKLADRIVMIKDGNIVYDDYLGVEILDQGQYSIETSDDQKLREVLDQLGIDYWTNKDLKSYELISISVSSDALNAILSKLVEENIEIRDIIKRSISLEELYDKVLN